jgi:hypothetical protein
LKRLIAYAEGGGLLECQDDVPDAFREELFLEEQQKLESLQAKGNKMLTAGNYPPINIIFMGGQHHLQSPATNSIATLATSPPQHAQTADPLIIDGPRDLAVREYSAWQETNVIDDILKAQFRQACDVTLANGLDLEQIHEDHDAGFYIEKGVAVGITRLFVSEHPVSIIILNNASVPEMAPCTFFSRPDSLDTPLKERGEFLVHSRQVNKVAGKPILLY